MYLRKVSHKYYELVRSVRQGNKVKTQVILYLGKLTKSDFAKIKQILKYQNTEVGWTESNKVSLKETRPNVYKKKIDLQWLKVSYLEKGYNIGQLAQLCGVSKDRIREHLDILGIYKEERQALTKSRIVKQEFGWIISKGKKITNPEEFKIIVQMDMW